MAPEVLAQPSAEQAASIPSEWLASYDEKVDVWGVGILVLEALTGRAPFAHANPKIAALKARFAAPPPLPPGTSAACCDFVKAALTQEPKRRPSADELLAHPWLCGSGCGVGAAQQDALAASGGVARARGDAQPSPFASCSGSSGSSGASGSFLPPAGEGSRGSSTLSRSSGGSSLVRSSSVGSFPMTASLARARPPPLRIAAPAALTGPSPQQGLPLPPLPAAAPALSISPGQRQPSLGVGLTTTPTSACMHARPRRCNTSMPSLIALDELHAGAEGDAMHAVRLMPCGSLPAPLGLAASVQQIAPLSGPQILRQRSLPVPVKGSRGGACAHPGAAALIPAVAAAASALASPAAVALSPQLASPFNLACPLPCGAAPSSCPGAGFKAHLHAWAGMVRSSARSRPPQTLLEAPLPLPRAAASPPIPTPSPEARSQPLSLPPCSPRQARPSLFIEVPCRPRNGPSPPCVFDALDPVWELTHEQRSPRGGGAPTEADSTCQTEDAGADLSPTSSSLPETAAGSLPGGFSRSGSGSALGRYSSGCLAAEMEGVGAAGPLSKWLGGGVPSRRSRGLATSLCGTKLHAWVSYRCWSWVGAGALLLLLLLLLCLIRHLITSCIRSCSCSCLPLLSNPQVSSMLKRKPHQHAGAVAAKHAP